MVVNPQRFLSGAGPLLATLGVLGITGQLGKISSASFFHPPHWINWFHLALGSLVFGVARKGNRRSQGQVTLFATVVATTIGLAGLLVGPAAAKRYNKPELADPSDHLAHLAVGLIALWAWLDTRSGQSSARRSFRSPARAKRHKHARRATWRWNSSVRD
jgi:hypothetical protein